MASNEELIYDPIGNLFDGSFSSQPYGGHSDHVHIALRRHPRELLALLLWAQRHGLHVGENPYFGGVDPVHTTGSFHYQTYGRKFHGQTLGKAADVTGTPQQMARFFRFAENVLTTGRKVPMGGGGGRGSSPAVRAGSNAAALLAALQPIHIQPQPVSFRSPTDVLAAIAGSPQSPQGPQDPLAALRRQLLGAA